MRSVAARPSGVQVTGWFVLLAILAVTACGGGSQGPAVTYP